MLPTITVAQTAQDISCDDDATFPPTGQATLTLTNGSMDPAHYTISWFESNGTDPLGTTSTTASFSPDNLVVSGLPNGNYFVNVVDNTNPGIGCPSETIEVIIEQFETIINIGATAGVDYVVTHSDDCTPENGGIVINNVTETRPAPIGSVSITGGDYVIGDYTFTWLEDDMATPIVNGASFPDVSFPAAANGTAGANEIAGLQAGIYYLRIQNTAAASGTGCVQPADDIIEFEIEDLREDPAIVLDSKTVSTFCNDANPNDGNGTLLVNILEQTMDQDPPTDYTLTWYRGQTATGGNELFIPANQGTAVDSSPLTDQTELSGLSQGFYTLEITKTGGTSPGLGCGTVATFEIIQVEDIPSLDEDAIQANATNNVNCVPNAANFNGTITINAADISGGNLNAFDIVVYQGSIAPGNEIYDQLAGAHASPISITDLGEDQYHVVATNATTGCSTASARVNIEDLSVAPVVVLQNLDDNLNCGGTEMTGSISVLADGFDDVTGVGTYTFEWFDGPGATNSRGVFTAMIDNLPADDYFVRVRNTTTGCETIREFEIEDQEDNPIIVNYEANNQTFCNPNGGFALLEIIQTGNTIDEASIDAGNYTLEVYSDPANVLQSPDGVAAPSGISTAPFEYTGLAAGDYYAVITNNDSNCESAQVSFTVGSALIYPVIQFTTENDDPCTLGNGTITATADGQSDSNTDYTFTWFESDGVNRGAALPFGNTSMLIDLEGGFYELEVFNSETGCTISDIVQLFENDQVDPEITGITVVDASTCAPPNGSIEITTVNQDTPAEYTFNLYDENPNNLGATPISTISGSANPVFTPLAADDYFVTAEHDVRGCTTAQPLQVRVEDISITPEVVITFVPNTRCDSSVPNGELHAVASTPAPGVEPSGYTFTWTGVNGTATPTPAQGQNTADLIDIPEGEYDLVVTNNDTGCELAADTYILTNEAPQPLQVSVTTSGNTNCVNFNGQMAATVISPLYPLSEYQYFWYDDVGQTIDPANPPAADYPNESLVTGLENGSYILVITNGPTNPGIEPFVTDNCTSVAIAVEIADETDKSFTPIVEVVRDKIYCYDEFVQGLGFAQVTNSTGYSLEWNFLTGADPRFPLTGTFADSLHVGNYEVVATNQLTGCEFTTPFSIIDATETIPNPEVTVLANDTHCTTPNGEALATVQGETSGFLFEWFDPSDLITPLYVGSRQFALAEGSYQVIATNQETGCESAATTVTVEQVITDPPYELRVINSLCLRTEDGAINQFNGTAYVAFDSANFVTNAEWYEGFDASGDRLTYPSSGEFVADGAINGLSPGNYSVSFTTDNGCTYFENFTVSTTITIYNFVSANGDSRNDFMMLDCIEYYENNLVEIFTRDGAKVWSAQDYNNDDVRFEGQSNVGKTKDLPAGTYFYIIDRKDGSEFLQGFIELTR